MANLLEINHDTLQSGFGRAPFTIGHNLADEPLLTLEELSKLAGRLPESQVEHALFTQVDEIVADGEVPQADIPVDEMVLGIEDNGCWMNLKRVNADPAYDDLLQRCLDEVVPHVADREGGETRREGYIFLSAPNAVTPAHIDPEHNLLLQIRGEKQVRVGPFETPEDEREALERYYGGGNSNVDHLPSDMREFELTPGDGLYFPVHFPHVVRNGPEVSISLSITFYTEASERALGVHSLNARLRGLGLSPAPLGAHPGRDRLKGGAWNGLRRAKNLPRSIRSRPRA